MNTNEYNDYVDDMITILLCGEHLCVLTKTRLIRMRCQIIDYNNAFAPRPVNDDHTSIWVEDGHYIIITEASERYGAKRTKAILEYTAACKDHQAFVNWIDTDPGLHSAIIKRLYVNE